MTTTATPQCVNMPSPPSYRCRYNLRSLGEVCLTESPNEKFGRHDFEFDLGVFDKSHLESSLDEIEQKHSQEKQDQAPRSKPKQQHKNPVNNFKYTGSDGKVISRSVQAFQSLNLKAYPDKELQKHKHHGSEREEGECSEESGIEEGECNEARDAPKKRKRAKSGRGSSKKRPRGGRDRNQEGVGAAEARELRMMRSCLRKAVMLKTNEFSIELHSSRTSTGWHGLPPPKLAREEVCKLYRSGGINKLVSQFFPVPCDSTIEAPTLLFDQESRLFFYRSSPSSWFSEIGEKFSQLVDDLLSDTINNPKTQLQNKDRSRGSHFPCIMGHYRAYSQESSLTLWHKNNSEAVSSFIAAEEVQRIIGFVNQAVRMAFPGVAKRFEDSAAWHATNSKIQPMFGLFWNLCINGIFPGQKRIHCLPHADSKNVVGVCALLVYLKPGSKFNHRKRSWLVIWEAGVVIELPPWTVALYPSSLLFHFNIDIGDIVFVTTDNNERPTPYNSVPMVPGDEEGRASLVFFNQASMYQSSETGYASLSAAKKHGVPTTVSFPEKVQEAFQEVGQLMSFKPQI